jgi:hypothetical protein
MNPTTGKDLLPFKVQQLLAILIEKQKLGVEDAMQYLYSSEVYRHLTSGILYWTYSTSSLYELLKEEKRKRRKAVAHSPEVLLFYAFCLESYKEEKQLEAEKVLTLFRSYHVLNYLASVYDTLHTQGKSYIVEEIDRYIKRKKRQYGNLSRIALAGEKANS